MHHIHLVLCLLVSLIVIHNVYVCSYNIYNYNRLTIHLHIELSLFLSSYVYGTALGTPSRAVSWLPAPCGLCNKFDYRTAGTKANIEGK